MKRFFSKFLLLFLLLLFSIYLFPISYLFKKYTVSDGLCQTQVISIFQDSKGRMWFGTYGGISLYDGVEFKNFFVSSGLLNSTVYSICEDSEGKIWVGTEGGVFYYNGKNFKKVLFKKFENSAKVTQIIYDHFKNRFFLTFKDEILEYYPKSGKEFVYKISSEQFIYNYFSLFLDSNGNLFFTDGEKIFKLVAGKPKVVEIEGFKINKDEVIQKFTRDPATLTWHIITTNRLYIVKENLNKTYAIKLEDKNDTFMDFVKDKENNIWAITLSKLFLIRGHKIVRKSTLKKKTTEGNLSKIYCDYEGNIWIGEDGGVIKKIPENIIYIDRNSGLNNEFIWSIVKYKKDKLLIGAERGFQILNTTDFKLSKPYLINNAALNFLKLNEDKFVILTDKGTFYFNGKNVKVAKYLYKGSKITLQNFIFYKAIKLSKDSYILVGNTGAILVNGKNVMRLRLPEEINRREITDIENFDKNIYLLATYNGIYSFELFDKLAKNVKLLFLKGINTSVIYKDKDKFYVGTLGLGIFELSKRITLEALPSKNNLNNLNVWSILRDNDLLWIGTSRGISLYNFKSKEIKDFNKLMNIPYSEIPGSNSFYKAENGDIYFGTSKGIIIYKKKKRGIKRDIPPKFYVDSIIVNGKKLNNLPPRLKIDYKTDIVFNFRCLSFYNEKGNKFSYRIAPLNKNFSEIKGSSLYFQYLKPGKYTLEVFATNSRGVVSKNRFIFELTVTPPIFQTTWFQIVVIFSILLIFTGIGYNRYHISKKEKALLEREVNRRTEKLKETEEKYKMLIESSLIPVFLIDFDGNILFHNKKVMETLEISPDDDIGNVKDYILPADYNRVRDIIERRKKGFKDHAEYEIRIVSKNGEIKNLIIHSVVVNHEGQDMILINALEVTKQKSLQKRLSKMQRLEALGIFAGGLAHNLNNLLQIIIGGFSNLKSKLKKGEPVYRELSIIDENLTKISDITNQILNFSGKGKYLIELIDIHELLDISIKGIHSKIGNKKIEILTNYVKDKIYIEGDKNQLKQCFQNILLNSIEAIKDSGRIFIETEIITKNYSENMKDHIIEAGKYVSINIVDDGIGFPPNLKDKVFDPFFTTKDFTKHKGFGLSTAYGIIKNHDGYIYIDSKENTGTKVVILIPLSYSSLAIEKEEDWEISKEEFQSNYIFEGKNILLIGENSLNYKLKRALENFGFYVTILKNEFSDLKNLAGKNTTIDIAILTLENFEYRTIFFKILKRELNAKKLFIINESSDNLTEFEEKIKGFFEEYEIIKPPFKISLIVEKIKNFFIE